MAQYYYVGADNESHGPIDTTQFVAFGLNEDTMVCPVGGQQWVRLGDVPGLANCLHSQPQYAQPQQYAQPVNNGVPPSSNLVWAILTTILCCLPFGIVAIVYAAKVNGLWAAGQYDEACRAAKSAGTWSIVAAVTGLVVSILYGIFVFFAASASMAF